MRCASENDLQAYKRDELSLGIKRAIREIENLPDFDSGVLAEMTGATWTLFCSYTHTGIEAVGRQVNGSTIEPNFRDDEVVQILSNADSMAMLAAFQLATIKGSEELKRALIDKV